MFSDEVAVTYPPQGPWQKSVFVDANLVEGTIGGIGRVRVKMIRRDGSLMAVLPSSYQDIVIVQAEDGPIRIICNSELRWFETQGQGDRGEKS